MMTLLGIAGLLFIVWAVRSVGRHPTQDAPLPHLQDNPMETPSVTRARQQYVHGRALTPDERETLADLRADRLAQQSHDARMAEAAGVAGVVTGAALAHHHDAAGTQNHIDAAAAAQRDAFAQTMNYDGGDDFDDGYARGYDDGFEDGRYDDDMYGDSARDDDLYDDSYSDDDMMYDDDDDSYDDEDWSSDDGFDDGFDDDFDSDDFGGDDFDDFDV